MLALGDVGADADDSYQLALLVVNGGDGDQRREESAVLALHLVLSGLAPHSSHLGHLVRSLPKMLGQRNFYAGTAPRLLSGPAVKFFCSLVPVNDLAIGIAGYNRFPHRIGQP